MTHIPNARARRACIALAGALAIVVTGCIDDALPTEPGPGDPAASVTNSVTLDESRASLDDVIERIMPALDEEALPPGLRDMLQSLANEMAADQRAAAAVLARAQAITRPFSGTADPELDAIGLALDAVQRGLGVGPRS